MTDGGSLRPVKKPPQTRPYPVSFVTPYDRRLEILACGFIPILVKFLLLSVTCRITLEDTSKNIRFDIATSENKDYLFAGQTLP